MVPAFYRAEAMPFRSCKPLHVLTGDHRGKESLPVSELVKRSAVDYPSLVQNVDLVGILDGAHAVSDDDPGHPAAAETFGDDGLSPVIQSTGRLIKKKNSGSSD